MKLSITIRELMDRHVWEEAADMLGWSPWVVNEGQAGMDDAVELSAEQAQQLGLIRVPGSSEEG